MQSCVALTGEQISSKAVPGLPSSHQHGEVFHEIGVGSCMVGPTYLRVEKRVQECSCVFCGLSPPLVLMLLLYSRVIFKHVYDIQGFARVRWSQGNPS